MMTDIIDINEHKLKMGELMFMVCECGGHEYAIVVCHAGNTPAITDIVCANCDVSHQVKFGNIDEIY